MTEQVTISLIGACVTVVVSTINALLTLGVRRRGKRNEKSLTETKHAVQAIKDQTDGINDKLVKVTGESEFARGLKQGEDNPR